MSSGRAWLWAINIGLVRKGATVMLSIQAHAQCSERFLEVIPEDKEGTELAIEDLVSRVLLPHFETVFVDEVTVQFLPGELPGQQVCSIYIRLACSNGETALQAREMERLELV